MIAALGAWGLAGLGACGAPERAPSDPPIARAVRGPSRPDAPSPTAPPLPRLEPGPDLIGLCDASAAAALDDRRFVVADDERNVLVVYDQGGMTMGGAVATVDLGPLSPLLTGAEADLEGMASAPDGTVWIIGSHDSGKETERQPERQRLFALRFAGAGREVTATLAHGPTAGLLASDPLREIAEAAAGHTSKDPEGLSIEGLALGPNGSLLVGFRAPIRGGKALVERIDNPAAFADGGAPTLAEPLWLDLGGRGIRSLEADGKGGYLIVAGPPAGGDPGFALFRWGGGREVPERLDVAFGDLNPEALVRVGEHWWVLSDDGGRPMGDRECKKLPRDQRRARTARIREL